MKNAENENLMPAEEEIDAVALTVDDTDNLEDTVEEYEEPKDFGIYEHIFRSPYEFQKKTYTKLIFNFKKLKGKDMTKIEREMSESGDIAFMPETSSAFLGRMAAKAGNIGYDVVENMPISDFSKVKNAARDFLISTGF